MLLDPAGAPCCAARTSLQVEPGPAHQGRSQVSGAGDPPLAAAGGPSHHRAEACPLRQTRQDWAAQCGSCDLKRGPPSLSQVGLARGPHSLLAPLMRVPGCPMPPPHYVPLSHFLLGNKRSSWVPSKETQQVSCLPRGPLLCPGGPPEPAWWGHRGGSSGLRRLRAHPGVDGVVQGLRARELGPRPQGTSPPGQAEALVPTAPGGNGGPGTDSHTSACPRPLVAPPLLPTGLMGWPLQSRQQRQPSQVGGQRADTYANLQRLGGLYLPLEAPSEGQLPGSGRALASPRAPNRLRPPQAAPDRPGQLEGANRPGSPPRPFSLKSPASLKNGTCPAGPLPVPQPRSLLPCLHPDWEATRLPGVAPTPRATGSDTDAGCWAGRPLGRAGLGFPAVPPLQAGTGWPSTIHTRLLTG